MATVSQLPLNNIVSFETYAPGILSTVFDQVKVTDHLTYNTAKALGLDVDVVHESIYPQLPMGTPSNPADYAYVRLQLVNGEYTIVGLPWINDTTIVSNTQSTLIIEVDQVTDQDRQRIINALSANGYLSARVRFKDPE